MNTKHLTDKDLYHGYMVFYKTPGRVDALRTAIESLPEPPPSPPVLKPITEPMPDAAEGCARIYWGSSNGDGQTYSPSHNHTDEDTHFLDIALPSAVDKDREEFEAACKSEYPDYSLKRAGDGYQDSGFNVGWKLFKAARNSKPAQV